MQYANDRKQFSKSLINFPRVSGKLAMMAVEIMVARQLTYFSAAEKDADRHGPARTMRCKSTAATASR